MLNIRTILTIILFLTITCSYVMASQCWDLYDKGFALSKEGKYEEAIKCYDQILEINDTSDPHVIFYALKCKGVALYELGKYKEAIKCYDRALNMDSTDTDVQALKDKAVKALNQ